MDIIGQIIWGTGKFFVFVILPFVATLLGWFLLYVVVMSIGREDSKHTTRKALDSWESGEAERQRWKEVNEANKTINS